MRRFATITWKGSAKMGKGELSIESGAFRQLPYSWHSRFENASGTNPEELLAAAHGGCFSMNLSAVLAEAGFPPDTIHTIATIEMKESRIVTAYLNVDAVVPTIDESKFQECLEDARKNCPMSKALNSDITIVAQGRLVR